MARTTRRRSRSPTSFDTVFLELVVERSFADAEQLGGLAAIAADVLERGQDRVVLEVCERADPGRLRRRRGRLVEPDVRCVDHVAVGEDRGALERVRELAHVAAPFR